MTEKTTTKSEKFAVIKTGGKQYIVREGDILNVEKMPEEAIKDGKVVFSEVLMIAEGENVNLGKPMVSGKTVTADVVEEGRAAKISVVHYKSKSRYFKRNGHRQPFLKVKITKIA